MPPLLQHTTLPLSELPKSPDAEVTPPAAPNRRTSDELHTKHHHTPKTCSWSSCRQIKSRFSSGQAARAPDTLTTPSDAVVDAPDEIDTDPDAPPDAEPLEIRTTPLSTAPVTALQPTFTAPLVIESLAPLRMLALPRVLLEDALLDREMDAPLPLTEVPPATSILPATDDVDDPLPMRTDPLNTPESPLVTVTLPLLLLPLLAAPCFKITTELLVDKPSPLVTDKEPPTELTDDSTSTVTSPPTPCAMLAPRIFTDCAALALSIDPPCNNTSLTTLLPWMIQIPPSVPLDDDTPRLTDTLPDNPLAESPPLANTDPPDADVLEPPTTRTAPTTDVVLDSLPTYTSPDAPSTVVPGCTRTTPGTLLPDNAVIQ